MSDREDTPQFLAWLDHVKKCERCGEENSGKGSIVVYDKEKGYNIPYAWNHPNPKWHKYVSLCRGCAKIHREACKAAKEKAAVIQGVDLTLAIYPPDGKETFEEWYPKMSRRFLVLCRKVSGRNILPDEMVKMFTEAMPKSEKENA